MVRGAHECPIVRELARAASCVRRHGTPRANSCSYTSHNDVRLLANLVPLVKPGALLAAERGETAWPHPVFERYWSQATADSFQATPAAA